MTGDNARSKRARPKNAPDDHANLTLIGAIFHKQELGRTLQAELPSAWRSRERAEAWTDRAADPFAGGQCITAGPDVGEPNDYQ
jgi:hypothetical protein